MAKGDLGAKILRLQKHQDVEIDGFKVRVRQMNAMRLFALRGALDGDPTDEAVAEALFFKLLKETPLFLPEVVSECCIDPESGEEAFTVDQAKTLPAGILVQLVQAAMATTQTAGAEEVKA